MIQNIIERLEKEAGFRIPYSFRLGPCVECGEITVTFWLPEVREWWCPECFYADSPVMQ
jgi:hypothetical protein